MPASRFVEWANAPAKTRDSGVTEAANRNIFATSCETTALTQPPEPSGTRGAGPSSALREVTPVTQYSQLGLPRKPVANQRGSPGNTGNLENEACRASPSVAADPDLWRDFFEERAAIREFDGLRPRAEAELLAWGDLLNKWHLLHGRRWPAWQCSGCDEPIGGLPALTNIDGNRVHFGCGTRFGERWRGAAVTGLRALGLEPPKGFELL
jgi:hypothetical protein